MKKRLLSATLLLCFLTTITALPAYGEVMTAAQPDADGLTGAIEKAKSTLAIDSTIWDDFTYNSYQSEQGLRWSLEWAQSANANRQLSVNINEQGAILSYNYNHPQNSKGLATVRQETAQQTAEHFLQRIAADYIDTLKLMPQDRQRQSGDVFTFMYQQSYDNIPVADGFVTVSVNKYTDEVTSFYAANSVNVTGMDWPDKSKVIAADKAQNALLSEIGVKMEYTSHLDYSTGDYRVYPVYRLAQNNLLIDALTGKAVPASNKAASFETKDAEAGGMGSSSATARTMLSPKEQASVKNMAQLISQEEAVNKLYEVLDIKDYTVKSSALYTTYTDKQRYIWRLEFTPAEQSESYVSGTVDAQTGQILSFNCYDASAKFLETAQSKAAADQAVAELLAQLAPEELSQCQVVKNEIPSGDMKDLIYNYERQVNGIAFPENGLTVCYNTALGKITSYQLDWQRSVHFPDISEAKTAQTIIEDMIVKADFRLMYQRNGQGYRLIYDFADKSAMRFNPFTGERLDWQGQPYVAQALPVYQWSGGISENGNRLLENGIYLNQNSLNINAALTQQDLAVLLYRSRYPYAETTDIKQVYNELSEMGLILQSEMAPDAIVTRQQAARYAVRLLGYERLLRYDKLFVYPYADEALSNYQTSVAIAGALELLETSSGNTIRPTAAITVGEAFDLLYKALRI